MISSISQNSLTCAIKEPRLGYPTQFDSLIAWVKTWKSGFDTKPIQTINTQLIYKA